MSHNLLCEMKWRTDVSSLANQTCYGLRYHLEERRQDKIPELIKKGVGLCGLLSRAAEVGQKEKITVKELGYCKIAKPLKEFSRNLEVVEKDSIKVLSILNSILEKSHISEDEVGFARNFLVDMGNVYQLSSWKVYSQLTEGGCF